MIRPPVKMEIGTKAVSKIRSFPAMVIIRYNNYIISQSTPMARHNRLFSVKTGKNLQNAIRHPFRTGESRAFPLRKPLKKGAGLPPA
jgi:hypothetical protein